MDIKSMKFKNIENNLIKIFTLIYENPAISKYIYYLTNDPLSESDVPVDLKENGYYFFTFFDGKVSEEEKIRVFINPLSGILNKKPMSDIVFLIELVIPNKYVVLDGMGQFRAFRIFDEISMMIDGQSGIGLTDAEITKFRSGRITDTEYTVFSIEIVVNSSTLKGLR